MSHPISLLGSAAQAVTPLPSPDGPLPNSGKPAASGALLRDTVSLSPLSPISTVYEDAIASSETTPGVHSSELFRHGTSDEKLVPIKDYGIDGSAFYAKTDGSNQPYGRALEGARPDIEVRKSVAERMQAANALLKPYGYELYVRDGWRDPRTQHAIFTTFEQNYLLAHPQASPQEARAHALRYASDPKFDPDRPLTVPLHATGGAVDVTLSPIGKHAPLDLGTAFDDTTPRAHTAYFETHAPRTADETRDKSLRELLNAVMLTSGFTNYPKEWWHFDYADRMYGAYLDFLNKPAPDGVKGYGYTQPEA